MTQEQNTLVEKMIKGPKNNPIPEPYAESMLLLSELILWHKYKLGERPEKPKTIS